MTNAKVSLNGTTVHSAVFDTKCTLSNGNCDGLFQGYLNRTATSLPVRDEPQAVYALFNGKHYNLHYNSGCCFEYGNAEIKGVQ